MPRLSTRGIVPAVIAGLLTWLGCARPEMERGTHGYILVSLDTLRADRLGAYGYPRPTSPFFDELARQGTLFERVLAPYPSTLVSHMSLFTGMRPAEHGVYPPSNVLPAEIPTLPERFRAAGFATAGHTEGGFVAGGYGFARGFDLFSDTAYSSDSDIERTFERGLDFLRALGPEERFFLFLHTYSLHDPYDPPTDVEMFEDPLVVGDETPAPDSRGEVLRDHNAGRQVLSQAIVDRFSNRYDASIRYVDGVLRRFVESLSELGLAGETTLIVTSDHGEEFLEHGRLGHTQLYPESVWVPLVIVDPNGEGGRRVGDVVELADIATTLVELADLERLDEASGKSLASYLTGDRRRDDRHGLAEVAEDEESERAVVGRVDGVLYQLLAATPPAEVEGVWVNDSVDFDFAGSALEFRARSFHQPRRVTVSVEGEEIETLVVSEEWSPFAIDLGPAMSRTVRLETDGCTMPAEVGEGDDGRCLSVMVQGLALGRIRLFDLDADPGARSDVARERPQVVRRLAAVLADRYRAPRPGVSRALSEEELRTLRALGYVD